MTTPRAARRVAPPVGYRTITCQVKSEPQKARLIHVQTWVEKAPRPATVVVSVFKERNPQPIKAAVWFLKEKPKAVTCSSRQRRRHK